MVSKKILISGTGRCGTTFLIKLFTFLDFDTGYTKINYKNSIKGNCKSGMEKKYNDKNYILKSPSFIDNIKNIIEDKNIEIEYFILPIRDYEKSADSRVKHGKSAGGLWGAKDKKGQLDFYYKIISKYMLYYTQYNIPTIFLDFEKMVNDKEYLFNKLQPVLVKKSITKERFNLEYIEAGKEH